DDVIEGATGFSAVATVLIATGMGLVALALGLASDTQVNQLGRSYHPNDLLAFYLAAILAYPTLIFGLALAWRGWAAVFALAVGRREWMISVLLGIAVLPFVALSAYSD